MQKHAKVQSCTLQGIEARGVEVETQISRVLSKFTIVGLPDGVLKESRYRVRCAIINSGFDFPNGEVVVNLAPASLPKSGSRFDFAIALSILAACDFINRDRLSEFIILGELALDGDIRSVSGSLAAAIYAKKTRKKLIIAVEDSELAAMLPGVEVYAVSCLVEAMAFINNQIEVLPTIVQEESTNSSPKPDFSDVLGQLQAKRALEIVAAGGHNLLMQGPPGAGKSMLAERLPSILPPLSLYESLEVHQIHSSYRRGKQKITNQPPFRAPHHSTSMPGLVGGGSNPVPGEISLAHRGVLFLDEFSEYRRDALESLRQPIETGRILVSRARARVNFPARFILLAAMNPCPCGNLGSTKECICTAYSISRYQAKISGPILDRIDLQVWVRAISVKELSQATNIVDQTVEMRGRVNKARSAQRERFKKQTKLNAQMKNSEIKKYCELDKESKKLLELACSKYSLSARSYNRIRKVSRTIADCEERERISSDDVQEALSYRFRSLS